MSAPPMTVELRAELDRIRAEMTDALDMRRAEAAKPEGERDYAAIQMLFEIHCDLFEQGMKLLGVE